MRIEGRSLKRGHARHQLADGLLLGQTVMREVSCHLSKILQLVIIRRLITVAFLVGCVRTGYSWLHKDLMRAGPPSTSLNLISTWKKGSLIVIDVSLWWQNRGLWDTKYFSSRSDRSKVWDLNVENLSLTRVLWLLAWRSCGVYYDWLSLYSPTFVSIHLLVDVADVDLFLTATFSPRVISFHLVIAAVWPFGSLFWGV
jgi:hypothetical protein